MLSKREKIILYITISVAIFGIIFIFLIAPVLRKAELLNKEINLTRGELKKYLQILNRKGHIQNKYPKFTFDANLSEAGKDRLAGAFSVIEKFAKDSNLQIIDIRPQNPRTLDLYKEMLIDLRTEGTIEAYLKFIYNIESSLLLLSIKRFQLITRPNTQALEGSFSISQLSLPE